MKKLGKKLYVLAFGLSILSLVLLFIGVIWHSVIGKDGLMPMLELSLAAAIFGVVGIVLVIIDIKKSKDEDQ